jgi:DNA-binding Lrp family transcriptional regulator
MNDEVMVLGAMLRLARRREAAEPSALALRVSASEADVRAALRRLEARGLVERRLCLPPRLTMEGFAVAVALRPARSKLAGGERHDVRDGGRAAREGHQAVEAQGVAGARRNPGEGLEEALVQGVDGQAA